MQVEGVQRWCVDCCPGECRNAVAMLKRALPRGNAVAMLKGRRVVSREVVQKEGRIQEQAPSPCRRTLSKRKRRRCAEGSCPRRNAVAMLKGRRVVNREVVQKEGRIQEAAPSPCRRSLSKRKRRGYAEGCRPKCAVAMPEDVVQEEKLSQCQRRLSKKGRRRYAEEEGHRCAVKTPSLCTRQSRKLTKGRN